MGEFGSLGTVCRQIAKERGTSKRRQREMVRDAIVRRLAALARIPDTVKDQDRCQ